MSFKFPTRSAHSILLKNKADADRIITQFPQPFDDSSSPYESGDFDPKVREACESNKDIRSAGLRASKVIIVGDYAVGKTSLVNRFCHKTFDQNYKATIGVDFEVQRFDVLGQPFNLQIWDTTGQEQFRSLMPAYYRRANVIILTFDLLRLYSLHTVSEWLDATLENNGNIDLPLLFLVGTKRDLLSSSNYEIMEKDAINLASAIKAEYWAVSSKTGNNIQEFFFRVAALAFSESVLKEIETVNDENPAGDAARKLNLKKDKKSNPKKSCGNCMSVRSSRN